MVYAYTTFDSQKVVQPTSAWGCINANKVWLNGVLVISNEVYHADMQVDQYIASVTLKRAPTASWSKCVKTNKPNNGLSVGRINCELRQHGKALKLGIGFFGNGIMKRLLKTVMTCAFLCRGTSG